MKTTIKYSTRLKKVNLKILTLAILVAILNVLFLTDFNSSFLLVAFELLILIYFYLKSDIVNYLGCYLVFLCLSFEFGFVTGDSQLGFYGFKSFKLFGLNLGIIMLLPIFFLLFLKKKGFKKMKIKSPTLYRFVSFLLFLMLLGVFSGLLGIAFNDNNINEISNSVSLYIGEIYQNAAFPFLIIISFLYVYLFEENKFYIFYSYIFSILVGSVFALMTSIFFDKTGFYGSVIILLTPLVSTFIPFIILFIFINDKIKVPKLFLLLVFVLGLFLMLTYNSSGKLILYLLLLPIIVIVNLKNRNSFKSIFMFLFLIPFVLIYLISFFSNSENLLFTIKLDQAFKLINIFETNWLQNLPESPRFRVSEFINIVYEYVNKPWYFMFGKGYLGSILDHQSLFPKANGAFSDAQYLNGSFYAMHFSVNTIFLSHGLLGLSLYFYVLKIGLKKLIYTPLGVIGMIWFLIYYGYSVTLSSFGLFCLLLALYEYDQKFNKNLI